MIVNKCTFKIDNKNVDDLFQAYMQRNITRWFPFQIFQWSMMTLATLFIEYPNTSDIKKALFFTGIVLNLVISILAYIVTKRKLWTASYFAVILAICGTTVVVI